MSKSANPSGSPQAAQKSVGLILVFNIAAWLVGLYGLWHRQSLFANGVDAPSFCNIGEKLNCDAVALSSYSAIGGVPVAALGMLFNAMLIFFALRAYFALNDRKDETATQNLGLIVMLAVFGLVPTFAMAAISALKLGVLCLMCIATYILNILIAWFAYKAWSARTAPLKLGQSFSALSGSTVVIGLVLVGLHLFAPSIVDSSVGGGGAQQDEVVRLAVSQHFTLPPKTLNTKGFPSRGPESAPVTIVEYSDFQCPHCARASKTLPQVLLTYGDAIRFVHKDYPLDGACNAAMKGGGGHNLACLAAKTGRCLFQDKGDEVFFKYSHTIFDEQESLSESLIRKTATDNGIAGDKLDTCLADYATQQTIVDEVAEGSANGVQGTPAIFINGRLSEYAVNPRVLKEIIDGYLKK